VQHKLPNTRRTLPLLLLALGGASHAPVTSAQDSPDVGVVSEALSIGVEISGSCDYAQASAALDAWKYIAIELRSDPKLEERFFNCTLDARYVEAGCDVLQNTNGIRKAILEDDYKWQFECVDFPPGHDMNGNPTRTLADAHIGIEGAKMRLDKSYLSNASKVDIAATMAHELMHNRGFTHDANDFGSPLYALTVPEQVEACVASPNGRPNQPPYANFWDREVCCEGAGYRFCDFNDCYSTFDGCTEDAVGGQQCGRFITRSDGTVTMPGDSTSPDAAMCGIAYVPLGGGLFPGLF
jgi:hypothetical protein